MNEVVSIADFRAQREAKKPVEKPLDASGKDQVAANDAGVSKVFDYGDIMRSAMLGVVARILRRVQANGLPENSALYITFDPAVAGVTCQPWMAHPETGHVTILLENWFEDLMVTRDQFSVTLNFSDVRETVYVPFASIIRFLDVPAQFGLSFDTKKQVPKEIA